LLVNYKSSNSSQIRNRLVEPFGYTTNFVAVWCFDIEAKSNKLFKTSRITNVECTGKAWKNEANHEQGHIDIFRISSYNKIPIIIKLTLRAYNLLLEEYPLAEKYITKHTDNEYILKTEVASLHGIARFVMGLPEDTTIIEPDELKNLVREKIKKLLTDGS
jgi:proteasome accessory factor C